MAGVCNYHRGADRNNGSSGKNTKILSDQRPQWESNPRPFDPKSNALIHCAMRSSHAI